MPQNIVLIGAGVVGQAGVVLGVVRQSSLYNVVGLVDDDASLHGKDVLGVRVLGSLDSFLQNIPDGVTGAHVCIGDSTVRERCFGAIRERELELVNVVHPSAAISGASQMGVGVFVGPNAVIVNGVKVGDGVVLNTAATLDHDNNVADFANISPGSHTSGRVTIGKAAFLGTGTVVLPDVTIGAGAYVGAGSVVTQDVPDGARVAGVPARPIR